MGRKSRLKIQKRMEKSHSKGKKNRKKFWKGLAILALIILVGVGCYYGYQAIKNRQDTTGQQTEVPEIDGNTIQINGGNAEGITVTPLDPNTLQPQGGEATLEVTPGVTEAN